MDHINILHLSDLHFGIEENEDVEKEVINKREITLESLLIKLKNLDENWKPHIVAVSGDIGYTGIKGEFDEASEWFVKLLKVLNLEPDRIVICAGNHDRFRYEKNISDLPKNIKEIDVRLKNANFEKNSIPFSEFITFQKNLKIPPLRYNKRTNFLVGTRDILGLQFLILNSAWFAWGGKEDQNKMVIGKSHLEKMIKESQLINRTEHLPNKMTIAVMHHHPEVLDPHEIDTLDGRDASYPLLAECSDLILCGHRHGEELFAPDKKYGKSWLFKTGALYEGAEYKNNCEILHIDPKSLSANRLKIYYIPDKKIWIDEVDDEGLYLFSTSLSRLRVHTQEILTKIHDKIGSDCKVKRDYYLNSFEQNLQDNNVLFIIGDPTVGKSVLMKDIAKKLIAENEVLAFNINNFNHNSLSAYLKEYNIVDDLRDILNSIKKDKIFVLIDQCERILEDENKKLNVFKDIMVKLQEINLENKELKLILNCRNDALQNVYSEFIHVYNCKYLKISAVPIDNLSDDELSQVFTKFPDLKLIYNQAHLKVLLKNPKMLDILTKREFKIFPKTEDNESLLGLNLTETYFMNQFWKQIVRNNEKNSYKNITPEARSHLLHKISLDSFEKSKPYKISSDIDFDVLNTLVSDKILIKDKDQLFFSHDVYEEWSLLDFIKNKSNLKDDFLIPYNFSKRRSRSFQLFSRHLLEIENDYETWKSIFNELENEEEINPNWIQEFILGILKSEISLNLLENLRDFLFEEEGNRFNQLLRLLRLKCIIFEGKIEYVQELSVFSSKPIYSVWFLLLHFILNNIQHLNNKNLYESSEIIRVWLTKSNPQVEEFNDIILKCYEEIANKAILNDEDQFDLNYEKEKKLKKNIIYGIIKCKALRHDNNLTIIENLRTSIESKWLFKDVIFDMFGWVPLFLSFPDYAIKILKDLFIRDKEHVKIIPTPFNYHDFDFSFDYNPNFTKTSFKIMLDINEEYGLKFIYLIINHAMKLWRKIEEPVIYGPNFRRISYKRTPIPQIIKIEGKEIEVWGDDIVYKWPLHLGPTIITSALQALEEWIIQQIQQYEREPIDLMSRILSNTKSFAVISVCSRALLHILFIERINEPKIIETLLEALLPIIKNPIFWILHAMMSSEEYLYYQKKATRFENIIEILLFYYTNLDIKEKIFPIIESFPNNVPFMFEEEKSDTRLVLDRQEFIDLIVAKIKKENYNPFQGKDVIIMRFEIPEGLIKKEEMRYQEEYLWIQSYRGTVFSSLENDGIINNYSIEELFQQIKSYFNVYDFFSNLKRREKYFKRLRDFLKSNSILLKEVSHDERPENLKQEFDNLKYIDWINDIMELITGFFSLLILFKWDFVKTKNLQERCKEVILNAVESKTKKDAFSAHMIYTMGIQQSAARCIIRLFISYPNDKHLKRAIKKLSLVANHQVRDILYTKIRDLWTDYPILIWKLVKKLRKKSIIRAIIMNPEFLVINKYRDPRITRSQFVDITGKYIIKLYVKRTLRLLKNLFSKQLFENLTPLEIDLKFYRSALNIIPIDETFKDIKPSNNFMNLLRDSFYFTLNNDVKYKEHENDDVKMQSYYGDCRNHFYREWIKKSVEIITHSIFHLNDKYLTDEFIESILSNWEKTEKFFEYFLEGLLIAGNHPEFEIEFIKIWYILSNAIYNSLKEGKTVKYSIISLLFFKRSFYSTLQNQFLNPNSLKKIGKVMKNFLEINLYPDIIWLINQLHNFELSNSLMKIVSVEIKKINYEENKIRVLRNNLSVFLRNQWNNFKNKILNDEDLFESFKFLVDKMVEWNSSLASKLQDDIKI